MDVKDELSHLSVIFVVGGRFLSVEVLERDIGAEKVDGVPNGGRVSDSCPGLKDASERGSFEETGEEEVSLQVGEGEELVGGRHREPKTGDDPSFYRERVVSKKEFITPFRL